MKAIHKLNEVKADNLGFYACSQTSRENELDFVIQIFCPSQLDYSQHGRPEKISLEHRKIKSSSKFCFILTILLCGDIHINPGPIKHPCTDCKKSVRSNQKAVQCDFCDNWTHLKCTNISNTQYHILSTSDDTFYCYECSQRLPNFTESFFNDTFSQSCSTSFNLSGSSQNGTINIVNSDSGDEHQYDIFSELNEARRKHPDTFSCAYLNINSLRYQNTADLPHVRTTAYGLQSFRYAGARLWNELPDELRKQSSLNQFKNLINSWSGSSCQCFACKTS
ncbi:uncharacterized protein LOC134718077 [Mytilus trossulus]|uniref:uncharacterized protein LOC134718077 n=1 Tax=Mytilus trossulus TaxID=6551 RepID=UPI003005064F